MAVKILEESRRRGGSLGLRVDDAVEEKRAEGRRRSPLQIVRSSSESHHKIGKAAPYEAGKGVPLTQAPARLTTERLTLEAKVAQAGFATQATAQPRAGRVLEIDPAFEEELAQACKIATPVRVSVRTNRDVAPTGVSSVPSKVASSRYRLTLRGQRALVALGFAASIAAGALVGTVIGGEPLPEGTSTVVVQSGDSLWSIASVLAGPGEDPRPLLDQIAVLNDLESPLIASGQTLVVPADSE